MAGGLHNSDPTGSDFTIGRVKLGGQPLLRVTDSLAFVIRELRIHYFKVLIMNYLLVAKTLV